MCIGQIPNILIGMINLKKLLSILLCCIFIILLPVNSSFAADDSKSLIEESEIDDSEAPTISSQAAIVMDATTGQILYGKNMYDQMYPASITKIMTTLVALENGDLNSVMTMSETAVYGIEADSNNIGLSVGEQISLEDALYAVMLVSANEAAWGVAEHISGSLENFCELMNQKAKELGCINTNFTNANGLHDENHYTCAYDMALITQAAMQNEKLVEIASSTYHEIAPTNMYDQPRELYQGNKMIREGTEYYYESCVAGKTGYTLAAQGTLTCWAKKDDVELIAVTLYVGSNADNYIDSTKLFDYYFDNYEKVYPLENYEFSPETLTSAVNHLNQTFNCENLGTMVLEADTSIYYLAKSQDKSNLTYSMVYTTDRLEDSIIGDILISDGDKPLLVAPVTYSGYINSEDEAAVQAAIASGLIEDPNKKDKPNTALIVVLILIILLAGAATAVYFRMKYVEKQRQAYRLKRDLARKQQRPF